MICSNKLINKHSKSNSPSPIIAASSSTEYSCPVFHTSISISPALREAHQREAPAVAVAAVDRGGQRPLERQGEQGLEEAPVAAAAPLPGREQRVLLVGGGLVDGLSR